MKTGFLYGILLLLFFYSCKKDTPDTTTNNNNNNVVDTATTLISKWKIIKDSVFNDKFNFPNGSYPIPGVYFGKTEDYYLFNAFGILSLHENGIDFSTTYKVLPKAQVMFDVTDPTYIATIININAITLTFQWDLTSASGGRYLRRLYLGK